MSGFALKAVVVAVVIALLLVIVLRAFRRVTPGSSTAQAARRQRMPTLVALAGSVVLGLGFFLTLGSFVSRFNADLMPMRIAGIVLFVIGGGMLIAYRNCYVEAGADAVRYRTIFGREQTIAYRDVDSCRTVTVAGRERVVVRAVDGRELRVDARRYDLSRVIAATSR